jgi:hypothetical protein
MAFRSTLWLQLALGACGSACGGLATSPGGRPDTDGSSATVVDAGSGGDVAATIDASDADSPGDASALAPSTTDAAPEVKAEASTDLDQGNDANADSSTVSETASTPAMTCQCRGCCDELGVCQSPVNPDTQCGGASTLCIDCTLIGGHCVGPPPAHCETADGGTLCFQTCMGCCAADGTCQAGFADVQCGENGGQCQDCTTLNPPSTCDFGSYPRACASTQTQCPAPYGGCPAAASVAAVAPQAVCPAAEIQGGAAACSGGPTSLLCQVFMEDEKWSNSSCWHCLQPFNVDFSLESGIVACAAPNLDAACDTSSGCLVDCLTQTCGRCADSDTTNQCIGQVSTGTCAAYVQADDCLTQALGGAAAFCNPDTYQGSFAAWFEVVATKYCAK